MWASYRYRIEPSPVQRSMLARTFGCCRVVFNDAVRVREDTWQAGEKITPTEVQRRVITQAKTSEERGWLVEVASVASVTVVREPDGHYYASFVVEIQPTPLPAVAREVGVDLGIVRLATCVDSTGARREIANPRHLAGKLRRLARLEREKARRVQGSANRAKTRRRVAVAHGKVARARLDYHHKQALTLNRDNQAVHVEDLNIAGLVRNRRLGRAIHDAGWAQFVRLIEEKAGKYGRIVHRVSRWLPSSKTCSVCGHVFEEMPLRVRTWVCPGCGSVHDRDDNAAVNILAAGQAERRNARGAQVRPPFGVAPGDEAGSTPDAA